MVLIVDDHEEVCRLVGIVLTAKGYQIEYANNGLDALEKLRARNGGFRAVITDYEMPGMNGSELRDRILSEWPKMAVAIMSGQTALEGIPFLAKPFTPAELYATLESVISTGV